MHSPNLKYWLALSQMPKMGPARIKSIFEHFREIEKIWQADKKQLMEVPQIHEILADTIINERNKLDAAENTIKSLPSDITILTLDDNAYPEKLRSIYDPPPVLYVKGNIEILSKPSLAIVGTRHPTDYGRNTALSFARELSYNNLVIVSGLAEGIDTAAHVGAINAGGQTIAVLGSGLHDIFPSFNQELSEKIIENGLLISEFPLDFPPSRFTFPQRNRIISALSLGVLVVEGSKDSGALITADFALEQGRDVFAIPGNLDSPLSYAPNALIRQGAKLVFSVPDILEGLNLQASAQIYNDNMFCGLTDIEAGLLKAIIANPLSSLEGLSGKINLALSEIMELTAKLEIKGKIKRLPGARFCAA